MKKKIERNWLANYGREWAPSIPFSTLRLVSVRCILNILKNRQIRKTKRKDLIIQLEYAWVWVDFGRFAISYGESHPKLFDIVSFQGPSFRSFQQGRSRAGCFAFYIFCKGVATRVLGRSSISLFSVFCSFPTVTQYLMKNLQLIFAYKHLSTHNLWWNE